MFGQKSTGKTHKNASAACETGASGENDAKNDPPDESRSFVGANSFEKALRYVKSTLFRRAYRGGL